MDRQQRQEVKQGTSRPIHRDYYYINLHAAIDAIKYRIYYLTEKVKDAYKPTEEKKDYFCPRCKNEYTQMEVLSNAYADGFLCLRCTFPLERYEISAADRAGNEKQSRLMSEIDPLLDLLKKIDAEEIPQNDFQSALSVAIPVKRNEDTHPTQIYEVVKEENKPLASRIKSEAMIDLDVTITTDEGRDEAERKAKELKAAQERQNALPSWHTESTIGIKADPTSPVTSSAPTTSATISNPTIKADLDTKAGILDSTAGLTQDDQVEQYYASLRAEEARREDGLPPESQSQSEVEDDDEDGFEDVDIGTPTGNGLGTGTGTGGVGTPSSSVSRQPSAAPSGAAANGSGKKRRAEDENGFRGNDSARNTPDGGRSLSKKVKLEPGADGGPVVPPVVKNEDVDSDDDEEFEDAL